MFPSSASASGHVVDLAYFYGLIGETGGTKFWYHGLHNCFITVVERDLLLPWSMTKRLINHTRPNDITEGYAADWAIGQLREPTQRIADRIDVLINPDMPEKEPTFVPSSKHLGQVLVFSDG